jgi:rhamnulokinase
LGNLLLQHRANGGPADLPAMRHLVAATQELHTYPPRSDPALWDKAAALIGKE